MSEVQPFPGFKLQKNVENHPGANSSSLVGGLSARSRPTFQTMKDLGRNQGVKRGVGPLVLELRDLMTAMSCCLLVFNSRGVDHTGDLLMQASVRGGVEREGEGRRGEEDR